MSNPAGSSGARAGGGVNNEIYSEIIEAIERQKIASYEKEVVLYLAHFTRGNFVRRKIARITRKLNIIEKLANTSKKKTKIGKKQLKAVNTMGDLNEETASLPPLNYIERLAKKKNSQTIPLPSEANPFRIPNEDDCDLVPIFKYHF